MLVLSKSALSTMPPMLKVRRFKKAAGLAVFGKVTSTVDLPRALVLPIFIGLPISPMVAVLRATTIKTNHINTKTPNKTNPQNKQLITQSLSLYIFIYIFIMSDSDEDLFADSDGGGDTDDLIAESAAAAKHKKPVARPRKLLKKKGATATATTGGPAKKRKRDIPGTCPLRSFFSLFGEKLAWMHWYRLSPLIDCLIDCLIA